MSVAVWLAGRRPAGLAAAKNGKGLSMTRKGSWLRKLWPWARRAEPVFHQHRIKKLSWWHRWIKMRLLGHYVAQPCNWIEWYEFVSRQPPELALRAYSDTGKGALSSVSGQGEFLDAQTDDPVQDERVRVAFERIVAPGKDLERVPTDLFAIFDNWDQERNTELNSFKSRLYGAPDSSAPHGEVQTASTRTNCVESHFSIYGDHVFFEVKHDPKVPMEERRGIRFSNAPGMFEVARKAWNGLIASGLVAGYVGTEA